MSKITPITRLEVLVDLDSLWRCFDELFASFTSEDWQRKHGKDWIFADVPYHLSYFDRDLIAWAIEHGENLSPSEQRVIPTMRDLNAWNAEKFAQRPAGETPEQSLARMRESRTIVRRLISEMTGSDLEQPMFMPLLAMGWVPGYAMLQAVRAHTWSELTQLKIRAGRSTPMPIASATHNALEFYMGVLAMFFVNRAEAARRRFTAVMEFTGSGGGAWTLRVADGGCTVAEERAEHPDLVMTQAPETFIKTFAHMHNPMLAMLRGEIKVRGFRKMPAFGKLFPEPKLDQRFDVQPSKVAA